MAELWEQVRRLVALRANRVYRALELNRALFALRKDDVYMAKPKYSSAAEMQQIYCRIVWYYPVFLKGKK